jgi:hypothetical protein
MGDKRNTNKILVGKAWEDISVDRKDNIKMDLKEMASPGSG